METSKRLSTEISTSNTVGFKKQREPTGFHKKKKQKYEGGEVQEGEKELSKTEPHLTRAEWKRKKIETITGKVKEAEAERSVYKPKVIRVPQSADNDIHDDITEQELFKAIKLDSSFDITQLKSSHSFEKMFAHRPESKENYERVLKQFQAPAKDIQAEVKPVPSKKSTKSTVLPPINPRNLQQVTDMPADHGASRRQALVVKANTDSNLTVKGEKSGSAMAFQIRENKKVVPDTPGATDLVALARHKEDAQLKHIPQARHKEDADTIPLYRQGLAKMKHFRFLSQKNYVPKTLEELFLKDKKELSIQDICCYLIKAMQVGFQWQNNFVSDISTVVG
jgi:hypothetical protein